MPIFTSRAKIYVAIYVPLHRDDPKHWAIYIDEGKGISSIHQLEKRENEGYRVNLPTYDIRPQDATRWKENIFVGKVSLSRVHTARCVIQDQPIIRESPMWNCQSWVLEALGTLQEIGLTKLQDKEMSYLRSEQRPMGVMSPQAREFWERVVLKGEESVWLGPD